LDRTQENPQEEQAMNSNPPRILIVDDNRSLVKVMEGILLKQGYQVLTAFGGMEGLEKARREKPALIILDIVMPDMNGYEVCSRLQRDKTTASIPVLMLTVKGQLDTVPSQDKRTYEKRLEERNKGFEVGAIDFVSKPVQAKVLIERIKRLLWISSG
jgi:DNA-binding response OmpR family regulator